MSCSATHHFVTRQLEVWEQCSQKQTVWGNSSQCCQIFFSDRRENEVLNMRLFYIKTTQNSLQLRNNGRKYSTDSWLCIFKTNKKCSVGNGISCDLSEWRQLMV